MDPNTLRLILLVVGVLLIALLYLWERHRERAEVFEEDLEEDDAGDAPYGVQTERREPSLGLSSRIEDPDADQDGEEDEDEDEDAAEAGWSAPASAAVARAAARVAETPAAPLAEPRVAAEPAARRQEPPPAPQRPRRGKPDPLLIQVSVSARRYPFRGPDLLEVAASCGLHPGDMDIFHCLDEFEDQTRIYFSMANMIKPGTFPFNNMDAFSTPGLMLFAQLEGHPEDMTILDEMIATARKLAMALNGDVLDARRNPLTIRKEEEMREAVMANEMRWARAGLP